MNKLNKNQFDLLHVSSFVYGNPDNGICDGKNTIFESSFGLVVICYNYIFSFCLDFSELFFYVLVLCDD